MVEAACSTASSIGNALLVSSPFAISYSSLLSGLQTLYIVIFSLAAVCTYNNERQALQSTTAIPSFRRLRLISQQTLGLSSSRRTTSKRSLIEQQVCPFRLFSYSFYIAIISALYTSPLRRKSAITSQLLRTLYYRIANQVCVFIIPISRSQPYYFRVVLPRPRYVAQYSLDEIYLYSYQNVLITRRFRCLLLYYYRQSLTTLPCLRLSFKALSAQRGRSYPPRSLTIRFKSPSLSCPYREVGRIGLLESTIVPRT